MSGFSSTRFRKYELGRFKNLPNSYLRNLILEKPSKPPVSRFQTPGDSTSKGWWPCLGPSLSVPFVGVGGLYFANSLPLARFRVQGIPFEVLIKPALWANLWSGWSAGMGTRSVPLFTWDASLDIDLINFTKSILLNVLSTSSLRLVPFVSDIRVIIRVCQGLALLFFRLATGHA